jgi:hypothetical protein
MPTRSRWAIAEILSGLQEKARRVCRLHGNLASYLEEIDMNRTLVVAIFLLGLLGLLGVAVSSQAQEVESERVTEENGVVVNVCGTGEGMQPCRDADGQTYAEELRGPDIQAESDSELAAQAAKIRNESPEDLDRTITEMEEGSEPY